MDVATDRKVFLAKLEQRFPSIAAGIDEISAGLLHCEMGVFSGATRASIAAADWCAVASHFDFATEVFSSGDAAVRNAVYVSYLENVLLGETDPLFVRARSMLPPQLVEAMSELEAHFEGLARARRSRA